MSDMADVLAEHRLDAVTYLVNEEEYLCICGKRSDDHEEHQSRALSAAGFGLVADVKAEPHPSCPQRLMDGRNEIRCWLPAGHEGEHK